MPLIPKPNYNQIFASQAPDIDKPAVFNNYPEGWGVESRPNNGKPTIKGFNYLQQTSDLKALWILQNGACLPYDESIEYANGAPVLKDGVIQYKTADGFKSRDSVTIPTYNNAADGVDPVAGVADGAYFNVRSPSAESYIDEYQNVGGSAVATGKSYPSSFALDPLFAFVDDQDEANKLQLSFNERFVFPQDFGAEPSAKLSSKFSTLAAAKFAYANIADQVISLDQTLFWAGLQSAIVSLNNAGGGEVIITHGNWLLSDPVYGASNVTITGRGDASLITAEVNTRWAGKHLFYSQDCDNFLIKDCKIDHNGRNRVASSSAGAILFINKSKGSGAYNVSFYDASDATSQSSTPQVLIVAKDVSDDLTDFDALIGGVDGAFINKCRFIMPDKNTRCGFAIRMMTDFVKQRPRADFTYHVENCDISGNSFNGDYFWNHIELAGGGTKFNKINFNLFTGSGLTSVDFDKGCNYNVAQGNIVDGWTFPQNMISNNNVKLAVYNDHGSGGSYMNIGNKMLNNHCSNVLGRANNDNEALYSIQHVENTLFDGNSGDGLNNGISGTGLFVENESFDVTFVNSKIVGVKYGAQTSASLATGGNIKFIDNDLTCTNSSYNMGAVAGSQIKGLKILGGKAKSTTGTVVAIGSGSRFSNVSIGAGLGIYGGVDAISVGADRNIIDNVACYDGAGRAIRLTGGETTITNSTSVGMALGDLVVNSGVKMPTLSGNNFAASANRNPMQTFASALPTSGTYINGDTVWNNAVSAGGTMGWTCTTAGTLGTLAGVTATTATGSNTITVNSSNNLKVGDYLQISGDGSAYRRITAINGTTVTLSSSVSATLSGAAVEYGAPVFKTFGTIAT